MNCKIIFDDDVITMQKTSYADIFKTACDTLFVDSFIRERVIDLIRNNKIQEALTCLKENVETSDFDIIIE